VTDVKGSALADALRERYLLERELGAGGMATVYLAQDVRHHRRVALKVLKPELAAVIGAERFLHEIETTANLQHPHILPLHDSGEVAGTAFYVMPYVEGESLRDRLTREKQLPIEVAVRIATEVASALDYAHRKGVIHRDIKPENILLHEGQALVADFGIALAVSTAGGARMTETGLSLGTPHYMSPEQATGEREITGRSDVYALGCVVYEMLTGDPPFTGSTAQAIVAQVVTEPPRPLTPRRHTIPAHIEAAVLRALEKLPADRFATPADFAQALGSRGAPTIPITWAGTQRPSRERLAWGSAGILALLLAGGAAYHLASSRSGKQPLVASLLPPVGCLFGDLGGSNLLQLSPDGGMLAFVAVCGKDQSLWLRSLGSGESRRLEGTTGVLYPFWAPDGRSLGFFGGGRLKRIDLDGGAVRDLAAAPNGRGGTWSRTGVILYAPDIWGPLYQVPASGGEARQATRVTEGRKDVSHRLPQFLPDNRHFLFSQGTTGVRGEVLVGALGSFDTRRLLDRPSNVAYADGFLLYAREGVLLAQPFDPKAVELSGGAVPVAPSIETWAFKYLGNYAVGGSRLVYREAGTPEARIDWLDPRTGAKTTLLERGPYTSMRLSKDGHRLLVGKLDGRGPLQNVWLYETTQGSWSRLSGQPVVRYLFAWSPDGRQVILEPEQDSTVQFLNLESGKVDTVHVPLGDLPILDWAPDGSYGVGTQQVAQTGVDLMKWDRPRAGSQPEVLYATPSDEDHPRISPDGRYLAYGSNQGGRNEVYLARLPTMTQHIQVSLDGAEEGTAWSRDGGTLYFLGPGGTLMSVSVATLPELRVGKPAPVAAAPTNIRDFEPAPDGRVLILYDDQPAGAPLTLVENWSARLGTR
jgi:serine/threonine-protein kinase